MTIVTRHISAAAFSSLTELKPDGRMDRQRRHVLPHQSLSDAICKYQ